MSQKERGKSSAVPARMLRKCGLNITDMKWFFGNIFRMPSLQEEFWKLWDVIVERGLVEKNETESSGDLFSADMFVDQIFEPIRATVQGMYR